MLDFLLNNSSLILHSQHIVVNNILFLFNTRQIFFFHLSYKVTLRTFQQKEKSIYIRDDSYQFSSSQMYDSMFFVFCIKSQGDDLMIRIIC